MVPFSKVELEEGGRAGNEVTKSCMGYDGAGGGNLGRQYVYTSPYVLCTFEK